MNDLRQIDDAIAGFITAYNRGDLESILAYYADDLIKLRQGAPAESKPEVAQRLRAHFASYSGVLTVQNDEIVIENNLAFIRGSLRIVLKPLNQGSEQIVERRFIEFWRKDGGTWRVARSMDNTAS